MGTYYCESVISLQLRWHLSQYEGASYYTIEGRVWLERNSSAADEVSEVRGVAIVAASNNDNTSNGPDVEWEEKL